MNTIISLLKSDPYRMTLLQTVAGLHLPDWYIAAGFVRNMVWDHLHGYKYSPLNDVDIIYFDALDRIQSNAVEALLHAQCPGTNWQVKNQAVMHRRNGDPAYTSSVDAMRYWPEKETAIGVQLDNSGQILLAAPFGTASLLRGEITHNPVRAAHIFRQRMQNKAWLKQWPQLKIKCDESVKTDLQHTI